MSSFVSFFVCPALLVQIMAVSFERLRARIGCCRVVLLGATQSMLPFVSIAQRNAIEDMLKQCQLDAENRSIVVNELASCNFSADDAHALVELAAGKCKNTSRKVGTGKLSQNYLEFAAYLPAELHDRILEKKLHPAALQFLMFELLGNLGMRRGDEHTYKLLSSFLSVFGEQPQLLEQSTPCQKWTNKNNIGKNFLKYAKTLPGLDIWCDDLPTNPAGLLLKHPELYKAALGDSEPCKSRLNMAEVLMFNNTYSCRNGGNSGHAPHTPGIVQLTPTMPPLQQMADFMFNGMKQLQESNLQMVQQMCGQASGAFGQGQAGLLRMTGGPPFGKQVPYRRDAGVEFLQEQRGEDVSENVSSGSGMDLAIVPARPREPPTPIQKDDAPMPIQDSDEPKSKLPKPSVASVLVALADRNLERAKTKAEEKKEKAKEKEIEKANMAKMLLASGRADPKPIEASTEPKAIEASTEPKDEKSTSDAPSMKRRRISKKTARSGAAYPPLVESSMGKHRSGCTYSLERSRNQVLCRTGFKGAGQSKALKYGPGCPFADEVAATQAAREWVTAEKGNQARAGIRGPLR